MSRSAERLRVSRAVVHVAGSRYGDWSCEHECESCGRLWACTDKRATLLRRATRRLAASVEVI